MKRSIKLWLFVGVVLTVPFVAFNIWSAYDQSYGALPYYGPSEVIDGSNIYHETEPFILINQDGRKTGSANAANKVSVINFFFTSCPTICPSMTRQLQRVQELYLHDPELVLMSISVDPEHDTPARLKAFAELFHADTEQWHFLTGDKKEIYRLARKSYYLVASDGDGGKGDFIHSENLVLVDREGHIRGYYDGTDSKAVDQLIRDITKLKTSKS